MKVAKIEYKLICYCWCFQMTIFGEICKADKHDHNRYVEWDNHDRQDNCFTRTCDQIITGRNLKYGRALQIVQNEEYLDEADLNIIRRRKDRVKRQIGTVTPVSQNEDMFTLTAEYTI